ncbi:uncharacterized protein LOC133199116 [Saccostrea echinata]|uniref:uncharacterized protein LOC133199116 n=1 Tax=Saccostrea echinata TaxID=191078 RepID=UPI002A82AA8E|nr:uncharacterized protein LOC133199116 [Saccostrea echinata]
MRASLDPAVRDVEGSDQYEGDIDTRGITDEDHGMKLQATLQLALRSSDFDAIKSIVENDNFDVNWRDVTHDLQSLVMKLCYVELNQEEVLQLYDAIFEKDPDLNLQDSHGRTALMHACIAGKEDIVDYLISDPTTRIEIFDFDGNSVLSHAVKAQDVRTTRRLLDHPSGHLLLEVYNCFGQRPIDIAEKQERKEYYNLLRKYQKEQRPMESQKKMTVLPPAFSPQNEAALRLNASKASSLTDVDLLKCTPRSTYIDDETPNLYLTSPKLRRKKHKRSIDKSYLETSLPAIKSNDINRSNKASPREQHKQKLKADSKQRERRNSISLPDLRDSPGGLVTSSGNTPIENYDYSSDSDFSDDAIVDLSHGSPRKPIERVVKRSASEKQIGFPSIDKGKEGSKVKRTLTEGSLYSNSDSKLDRLKLLQKTVLS